MSRIRIGWSSGKTAHNCCANVKKRFRRGNSRSFSLAAAKDSFDNNGSADFRRSFSAADVTSHACSLVNASYEGGFARKTNPVSSQRTTCHSPERNAVGRTRVTRPKIGHNSSIATQPP
jgi:hypothetical protein